MKNILVKNLIKNILDIALKKEFPILREDMVIVSNYKLCFIKFNISAKIDKDFKDTFLRIIRMAVQGVSEEYSLDGVEFDVEIV